MCCAAYSLATIFTLVFNLTFRSHKCKNIYPAEFLNGQSKDLMQKTNHLQEAEFLLNSLESLKYISSYPHFMVPLSSLPHSQQPATGTSLEPDKFSSQLPNLLQKCFISYFHIHLSFPSNYFPLASHTKTLDTFLFSLLCKICPAMIIIYLAGSTNHQSIIFSSLLLFLLKHFPQDPVCKHRLCSSLNVRDHASHPLKQQDKTLVLYILSLCF
jgi:hypothetical protein